MRRLFLVLGLIVLLPGASAQAKPPNVVADIAPVHSLVAIVMSGVGTPALIVQPGVSPHDYALRPSEARALQNADLVFWVSAGLTPWLVKSVESLSDKALTTELMLTPGTLTLEMDEDHAEHDHDHGDSHGIDPHGWLDPRNAMTWITVIAQQLSQADPENADTYRANAARGIEELRDLTGELKARLAPLHQTPFITFHDAYQYFETAFGVQAAGSISISDASPPSPARIAEIRSNVSSLGIRCVLAEPQFNVGLVETVMEGTAARTAEVDPIGTGLTPGAQLYPNLIRNLADTLTTCLAP